MFRSWIQREIEASYQPPKADSRLQESISSRLLDTLVRLREICDNTSDLQVNEMTVCGIPIALVLCEGMVDAENLGLNVTNALDRLKLQEPSAEALLHWMEGCRFMAGDKVQITTYEEVFTFIMSGFAVILIDGSPAAIAVGVQGFQVRSISEPSAEINLRGSREGFVEAVRINMSMIRRRMKTPCLKLELRKVGVQSRTDVCLVYRTDMVNHELLEDVRRRLDGVQLDIVLESGYLQPFLDSGPLSIFSGIGVTERPDTVCAKVSEGRVVVLVDGTPFALITPYLFSENFQSVDDYAQRPFYATFMRWLKYGAFFLTILLPGTYVAMGTFHPELFPDALLFNVAIAEEGLPFPLMFEALLIHFLYEIMREAGLRLPRSVGHAVSIVGALVIGDAAVTAGLIGTPMVMVVALTTISSFVIPSLYEPVTLLRFVFIVLGGCLGIFGLVLGLCVMGVNLCAVTAEKVPATSPESPSSLYSLRDTLVRVSWRQLGKRSLRISALPGSELEQEVPPHA